MDFDDKAQKISESITIDGNVEKTVCANAKWSNRFVDIVTGQSGMYNTQAALLWSNSHLYIAFKSEEPFIEATKTERNWFQSLKHKLKLNTYTKPKYEMIKTHTDRRSFCTNAYLSVMDSLDRQAC